MDGVGSVLSAGRPDTPRPSLSSLWSPPSLPAGRSVLWCGTWLLTAAWLIRLYHQLYEVRWSWGPIIIAGLVAVDSRFPRLTLPVALAVSVGVLRMYGAEAGSRFLVVLLPLGVVTGLVAGAVRPARVVPRRWRPASGPAAESVPEVLPASLVPAAALLSTAAAIMALSPGSLRAIPALWQGDPVSDASVAGGVVALALAVAVVPLFVGALASPSAASRLAELGRPIRRGLVRAVTPLWRPVVAVCRRATRTRQAWWSGEYPALGPVPEPASSDTAGGSRLVRYRTPVLIWLVTFLVVNASILVSPRPVPAPDRGWFDPSSISAAIRVDQFAGWSHWDSDQYLRIAQNGYRYSSGYYVAPDGTQQPAAWFPGYGMAMRAGVEVVALVDPGAVDDPRTYADVGMAITVASGLAVALLFWKWLTLKGIEGRRRLIAFCCLMLYPYSFMLYGTVYSDPLFLALVLGTFVLWETDRRIAAGLVGFAATIVRINGMALIAALAVAAWAIWRERADARVRRAAAVGAALTAAGLGSFVVWCGIRYGEPLMYWNAHSAIFGKIDPTNLDDLAKTDYFPSVIDRFADRPWAMVNLLVAAAMTALTFVSCPAVKRRYGTPYAVYLLGMVVIIWFASFDFIGAGRYLICAFPLFALWGEWLAPRRIGAAVAGSVGVAGTLVLTYCFYHVVDLGW